MPSLYRRVHAEEWLASAPRRAQAGEAVALGIEILPDAANAPSRRVAERCGHTGTGELRALPRDPEREPSCAVYAWEA